MANPKIKIKVTAHRFAGAEGLKTLKAKLGSVLQVFSKQLAVSVGEAIFKRLKAGDWHTSRNKRYGYYRTWLKFRYGSSRARSRGAKGSKQQQTLQAKSYNLPASASTRDKVERLKYLFLVRYLNKHAEKVGAGANLQVGPSKTTRKRASLNVDNAYNVAKALEEVQALNNQYHTLESQGDTNRAQQVLRAGIERFLYARSEGNTFFQETQLGQRVMRQAEVAALRYARNDEVLNPNSKLNKSTFGLNTERLLTKNQAYRRRFNPNSDRVPALSASGNFPWGYQTGNLAKSWQASRASIKHSSGSYEISVRPNDVQDGRTPVASKLTGILQAQISKQGGDPRLLTRELARESVKDALEQAKAEFAKRGVRIKEGA